MSAATEQQAEPWRLDESWDLDSPRWRKRVTVTLPNGDQVVHDPAWFRDAGGSLIVHGEMGCVAAYSPAGYLNVQTGPSEVEEPAVTP